MLQWDAEASHAVPELQVADGAAPVLVEASEHALDGRRIPGEVLLDLLCQGLPHL